MELLFTIKPFGGLLATSGNNINTNRSSGKDGSTNSLGHLAYIQPGASVVLQLQQEEEGTATAAADAATATATADATCGVVTAGGVSHVEIDLDALFPWLCSSSVLVEVVAGDITRTMPR